MILSKGDHNTYVGILQKYLINVGYDIKMDNDFGMKTDHVVREFQASRNLVPDGIVGNATWAELKPMFEFLINNISKNIPNNPDNQLARTNELAKNVLIDIRNHLGWLVVHVAKQYNIDPDLLFAIIAVESGGKAFTSHGVVIRFENHVFARQIGVNKDWVKENLQYDTTSPWLNHKFKLNDVWYANHIWPKTDSFNKNQEREWLAFNTISKYDYVNATRSISMGLPQMMGFNHRLLGYDSSVSMLKAFSTSIRAQLLGMFDFIIGVSPDQPMLKALQKQDLKAFTRLYNGNGQVDKYSKLIDTSWRLAKELQLGDSIHD